MSTRVARDFDDYAAGFPPRVQQLLRAMRETIRAQAPQATEEISYGMPTFRIAGMPISFGAFAHHIGFYPGAAAIAACAEALSGYQPARGSVQFPFDEPLPLALVADIVKHRAERQRAEPRRR